MGNLWSSQESDQKKASKLSTKPSPSIKLPLSSERRLISNTHIKESRSSYKNHDRAQPREELERSDCLPNKIIFEYSDCFTTDYHQYLKNSKLHEIGITTGDRKYYPISRNTEVDNQLVIELQKQNLRKDYRQMIKDRQKLPAYKSREAIIDLIEKNQVIVLVGETGCGKTTQVPQYILDSFIESGRGSLCKIICTQPRRISATGVAHRVASERCIPCGGLGPVGYQIRLDCKKPREYGSILFCTTGILLVQLQNNPLLSGISHVIVDEVHERDQLSDFLLMCLQDILKENANLKVILMSATVNAQQFSSYFGNCPTIKIPGFTYHVTSYYLEDILYFAQYKPKMQNKYKWKKTTKQVRNPEYEKSKELFYQHIHSRFPYGVISTLQNWNEDFLDLNLIAELLKYICSKQGAGTILVFLPGWQEITMLNSLILKDFPPHKYLIIALHSQTADQCEKQVLNRAPAGIRKIILATNIAETSITIDDCTVIIDSGRFKQSGFDPVENMHILETQWVAMSNVKQRRGRAGRTQPGESYHMFTSLEKLFLEPYQVPEMQRCSLEQLILNIKILKQCRVLPYLQTAISPPKPEAVEVSLRHLRELNAITAGEILTPLGFLLAKLPVDIHVGKMLLYGAIFSCLDPITSIAACLSFKDPFTCPVWKQKESKEKKMELADGERSDHMLFVNVLKKWGELEDDRVEIKKLFCRENFVSYSTLQMLMELKQQFARYLKQLEFLKKGDVYHPYNNVNSGYKFLIKSIIGAALYPNIVEVEGHGDHGPLRARTKDGKTVFVHPKSINSFQYINTGWLAYHVKVKSTKVYIHDTTDIPPYSSSLLGSEMHPFIDRKSLKYQLYEILEKKFMKPSYTDWFGDSREIRTLKDIVDFITESYL